MSVTTTEPIAQTGTPGQQGGEGQGSTPATQSSSGAIQFTPEQQAHIDRLIADRLARQKATIEGQTKAEREKAEREAAEAKAREQGEYRKLAESEKARADKAEQEKAEAESRMRERLIRSEIKSAAATLNFVDPADAYRFVDVAAVTFDERGDPANVAQLLADLVDPAKGNKAYLIKAADGAGAHIPPTGRAGGPQSHEAAVQERYEALKKSGRYAI